MTFTDDDLKRLKEDIDGYEREQFDDWGMSVDEVKRLLARLEAAEELLEECNLVWVRHNSDIAEKLFEAWRKACGR